MIKKGDEIIGYWGAGIEWSYGKIIRVKNGLAEIDWHDNDTSTSVEEIEKIKTGDIKEIGLYKKEC